MMDDQSLEQLLRAHEQFTFGVSPKEKNIPCKHAQEFEAWAQGICQEALQNPTRAKISLAITQITIGYREKRKMAPKSHRNHIGDRGHRCLFHVFDEVCEQLANALWKLAPPLVSDPAPPAPLPPPPVFSGVAIKKDGGVR